MGKNDGYTHIEKLCKNARRVSPLVAALPSLKKNIFLRDLASEILDSADYIISENSRDINEGKSGGLSSAMLDRLLLTRDRIKGISASIESIAALEDPVGRVEGMSTRPSGIRVGRMRVPVGVVAVIFESRPNVTADIAALCLKSGNVSVLRGGREALNSNTAIHSLILRCLERHGIPAEAVNFIGDSDRELVNHLLTMDKYIDIVIPRGGGSPHQDGDRKLPHSCDKA